MIKVAFNMGVTKAHIQTFNTMSDIADQIAGPSSIFKAFGAMEIAGQVSLRPRKKKRGLGKQPWTS